MGGWDGLAADDLPPIFLHKKSRPVAARSVGGWIVFKVVNRIADHLGCLYDVPSDVLQKPFHELVLLGRGPVRLCPADDSCCLLLLRHRRATGRASVFRLRTPPLISSWHDKFLLVCLVYILYHKCTYLSISIVVNVKRIQSTDFPLLLILTKRNFFSISIFVFLEFFNFCNFTRISSSSFAVPLAKRYKRRNH